MILRLKNDTTRFKKQENGHAHNRKEKRADSYHHD